MVKFDYRNVPLSGHDPEPPEKNPNGPNVGLWMENPADSEVTAQTVVVAEYIKGVGRAKRL